MRSASLAQGDGLVETGQAICFHCGLPVPAGRRYPVTLDGVARDMCCRGCQAVAQAIVSNGLTEYYRLRSALPDSAPPAPPELPSNFAAYDLPQVQASFVRHESLDLREAALIITEITCAACVWLNERHLAQLPGVLGVEINYVTHRARIRWDERRIRLSRILYEIAAIGYSAHPFDPERQETLRRKERNAALWRLFVAGFSAMQVMMYAVPAYLANGDMSTDIEQLMRWASLILTLPVMLYSATPFFRGTWRDLKQKRVSMDTPVATGVAAAFAASAWATVSGSGAVYFDSISMFMFFLLCGRYLEMSARAKASQAVEAIAKLIPASARRLPRYPDSRENDMVPVASLRGGDFVLIAPGENVPADGVVREGNSEVDEALLSGESRPAAKKPGDALTCGTVNAVSPLIMQVEKVGQDTVLSSIVRMSDRALAEKPRLSQLADRIAGGYVLVLLLVASCVAALWYAIDPSKAFWITVSVLVVSCPCALSLANPAALTVAIGSLARSGLLITRGSALEILAQASHFVFDKTGTLTLGRMTLAGCMPLGSLTPERCLAIAGSLENASEHVIAKAVTEAARERRLPLPQSANLVNVPGCGVEGKIDGKKYRLGTPAFVAELAGTPAPEALSAPLLTAATVIALGDQSGHLAVFSFNDPLRPDAALLIRELRRLGKQIFLLSGDTREAVRRTAAQLGIECYEAQATPARKLQYVRTLQEQGAVVAMVGDGVNDAPVLAQAQVSIAMGHAAHIARTRADIVLFAPRLAALYQGVALARKTLRVIRQNLAWAVVYNLAALPLAATGHITPWMAGIGMSASSLLVVFNSLRLLPKLNKERAPAALALQAGV